MNKKVIIICAIILVAGCFMIYHNQGHINVRGTNFAIPQGYYALDEGRSINVTDGVDSVLIVKDVQNNNLNESIEYYINSKEKENYTVELTTSNINGMDVYKGTVQSTDIVYYWFMKNDNLYWLYSWSASQKTDSIAYELIKSTDSII